MTDEILDIDKARNRLNRDLRAIVELYDDLAGQAVNDADDPEMPGGDALVMLGPVANLEAWENRYEAAESSGRDIGYVNDQLDAEDHPLLVLATWEDVIRDQRNQPTDLRATVVRAADYLRKSTDFMFSVDEFGDWAFLAVDEVLRDLSRVRNALERVLYAGERSEMTRVPCVREGCDLKPRLVKVYAISAAADFYLCQSCRHRYDQRDFISASAQHMHRADADEAWVKVSDAAYSVGRPVQTLRTWIANEKISTQIVGSRPTAIWVLWSDVRDADRTARRRVGVS